MDSVTVPLIITGVIFIILLGLLFYWLYTDNKNRVLGCVPCRQLFMGHKHLDDKGVSQKPLMYQSKFTELATIDGKLQCPCQRFNHITSEQAVQNGKILNLPSTLECQNTTLTLEGQNTTLTEGHEDGSQFNQITDDLKNCDVIIDDCQRCQGCKCTPVSMYRTIDRSETSGSNGEQEMALSLTPEITFVMCSECKCGCQQNEQQSSL